MAIAEDASSPAVVHVFGATSPFSGLSTASFSPPANSLVVAIVNFGYSAFGKPSPSITVADSGSVSYTAGPAVFDTDADYSGVFTHYYSSAPGSITVTASDPTTWSGGTTGMQLTVKVLTGANSSQSGAGSAFNHDSAGAGSAANSLITTTTAGSFVYVAATFGANTTLTPFDSNTTSINALTDATEINVYGSGEQTAATVTPGSTRLGWTAGTTGPWSWAALEILPAAGGGGSTANVNQQPGSKIWRNRFRRDQRIALTTAYIPVTYNGAFTASVTAQATFNSGAPPQVLMPAVPGLMVPGLISPGQPGTAPPVMPSSAVIQQPGGKSWRRKFRRKQQTVINSLTGSQNFNGALTTTATAQASFAGIYTGFGALTAAITAAMTSAGVDTGPGTPLQQTGGKNWRKRFRRKQQTVITVPLAPVGRSPMTLGGVLTAYTVDGSDTEVANNLGGSLVAFTDDGTIAATANLGGTAALVVNSLGGTISAYTDDGSIATTAFGGSATGWTMQNINLNFAEFNDITLTGTITNSGSALNLTGYTVNMYLKPTAGVVDTDGRVIKLSSAGGSPAITITNAASGAISILVANADVQNQNLLFYRIDAVDASSHINTAIYGNITYTAL